MTKFNIDQLYKTMDNIDTLNETLDNTISETNNTISETNNIIIETNNNNIKDNTNIEISYNDIAYIYLLIIIGGFNFDKLFKLNDYSVD